MRSSMSDDFSPAFMPAAQCRKSPEDSLTADYADAQNPQSCIGIAILRAAAGRPRPAHQFS